MSHTLANTQHLRQLGALAGEYFYFIANSHLNHYDKGTITDEAALNYVQVMRIKLKD